MIRYRKMGALLAAVLVSGVLMGCTQPATPNSEPSGEPAESVSAQSSETTEPIPGDLDGNGHLDGWEKEQLARGQYVLPDGSAVAIVPDQPLPASVVQAVQQQLTPLSKSVSSSSGQAQLDNEDAFIAAIKAEEGKINRQIVPVTYARVSSGRMGWAVGQPAPVVAAGFGSQAAAVAYATQWVNGDQKYVVMVFV
jgi:hypothetical protein